jgi:hypothetical protein
MSVSTNTEMRIRGREPSRVPAKALQRVLPIKLSRRAEEWFVTIGHVISAAGLGAARGMVELAPVSRASANLGFTLLAFAPDFVLMPALGSAPPPWRWRKIELAISALHHGVYAAATSWSFRWLTRRAGYR